MSRFLIACSLLSHALAHAAIDGVVVNRTTGKPQPDAIITLYSVGGPGGLKPVKTTKTDAQGAFSIDAEVTGPNLLQAIHSAVTYSQMLPPGSKSTGLEVSVYESSPKSDSAKVSQHMIILEPFGNVLHVNETVMFHNSGNTTFNDPSNGTLQVFVPDGVKGNPRLTATAPQGMPVERQPAKTTTPNVYKIDFAVKPGETRFDLSYVMDMPASSTFVSKVLHEGGAIRLVAPQGVTLTSDSIRMIGQEPKTQAKVYEIKGKDFSIQIEGTGQLGPPEGEESDGGASRRPGIQSIRARIYDQVFPVLGLALITLAMIFLLLYRRGAVASVTESKPEAKRR